VATIRALLDHSSPRSENTLGAISREADGSAGGPSGSSTTSASGLSSLCLGSPSELIQRGTDGGGGGHLASTLSPSLDLCSPCLEAPSEAFQAEDTNDGGGRRSSPSLLLDFTSSCSGNPSRAILRETGGGEGGRGASLRASPLLAGDWRVPHIFSEYAPETAAVLATFEWPISDKASLGRLLSDPPASPEVLVACEFTGAVASEVRSQWGCLVLSVDTRPAPVPGLHATLDLHFVLHRRRWRSVFAFPPCTHQTLADRFTRHHKELDGRTFWGIAFFIYVLFSDAASVLVEQPDSIIPNTIAVLRNASAPVTWAILTSSL
jgi:hypothetical protein